MEDKIKETAQVKTLKMPRDRSSAYPSINLGEAIECIEKIKKALSNAPFNRENGAKALGYSGVSGASAAKIAALVHFGLVSRTGDVYKLSLLADRILIHKSEEDKKNAIVEALKNPKLYRELIEEFKNQALPTLLNHILVRDHKISEKVSKQVVKDFSSSLEFAGLLINGVVSEGSTAKNSNVGEENESVFVDNERGVKPSVGTEKVAGSIPSSIVSYQSQPLPSGIIIYFPIELAPYVSLGEFLEPMKALEKTANEVQARIEKQPRAM